MENKCKKSVSIINRVIEKFFNYDIYYINAYNNIYKTHFKDGGMCPDSFTEIKDASLTPNAINKLSLYCPEESKSILFTHKIYFLLHSNFWSLIFIS